MSRRHGLTCVLSSGPDSVLWPLFHYCHEIDFSEDLWNAYSEVNRLFARAVAADVRDGALGWVHDYHLLLLPQMLREEIALKAQRENGGVVPNVKIGFFLHTPFPSSEIYRILPAREAVLRAVLHTDLLGFHTHQYARHFRNACAVVLGGDAAKVPDGVTYGGRTVRVDVYPIGIEPARFHAGLQDTKVRARVAQLEREFAGRTVILGVDRLDYIKGMPRKLAAFEQFLAAHPEWRGKVMLVQVAVPSRDDVPLYQELTAAVHEAVGRINGRFGRADFTPIRYVHRPVDFAELLALYAVADVCLVTSTRDGMNLVSFEYVAAQRERQGVLCLSEFAGAADSLHGALIFNPYSAQAIVSCIHEAVSMSPERRAANFEELDSYVNEWTR